MFGYVLPYFPVCFFARSILEQLYYASEVFKAAC